jgi:hypothetical protein
LDLLFFLKHCQYLLIALDTNEVEDIGLVLQGAVKDALQGALRGYVNQYVATKAVLKDVMKRRPTWHHEYLQVEEACFSTFETALSAKVGILCGNEVAASGELETAKIMRDTLKEHLISIEDRSKGGLQRPTWSKIINSSAGPYEESTEYFAYGILDYVSTFILDTRSLILLCRND